MIMLCDIALIPRWMAFNEVYSRVAERLPEPTEQLFLPPADDVARRDWQRERQCPTRETRRAKFMIELRATFVSWDDKRHTPVGRCVPPHLLQVSVSF
ncbi:hypothetical protein ZHAS_00017178 [Anopheles sinensis]|uniref:Uncharacterized protein n=1 Tax=Anopheles sinensis TaxID=74873 RepID=A0A084WG35_ANOSI|nr:hypothetical protein ZHAS_00017178 [Anopheles sinensis]